MRILTLDTCTEVCSVALMHGSNKILRDTTAANQHSTVLLKMIDEVLVEAHCTLTELDAIGFSRGPGSFTGVRIGAAVVQGLAFAANLPVIPLSSLAAVAQRAVSCVGASHVIAVLDARMDEVYWAAFKVDEQGIVIPVSAEQVSPAHQVSVAGDAEWWIAGTGLARYGAEIAAAVEQSTRLHVENMYPQAEDLLPLATRALANGQAVKAEQALPVYLRDNVARKSSDKSTI